MFEALLRSDILVKLPQSTDDVAVMSKGGIYVSTLAHKEKFNPTHGTVVEVSPNVKHVEIGDEVFFGNHLWDIAKRRAFGDDDKYKGQYFPDKVFALKEGDACFLILPEWMIYFCKRGEQLIGMNQYVIAEPIQKEKQVTGSGLILVDLQEEQYKTDMAKVFIAPKESGLSEGDVVHTLRHCDIAVEEDLNQPILPKKYFFIELDDIIAKYEAA